MRLIEPNKILPTRLIIEHDLRTGFRLTSFKYTDVYRIITLLLYVADDGHFDSRGQRTSPSSPVRRDERIREAAGKADRPGTTTLNEPKNGLVSVTSGLAGWTVRTKFPSAKQLTVVSRLNV